MLSLRPQKIARTAPRRTLSEGAACPTVGPRISPAGKFPHPEERRAGTGIIIT